MPYKWEGLDILAPLTIKSNQTIWTVEKLDKSIDRMSSPSQRWDMNFSVKDNENEGAAFKAMTSGFASKSFMPMPNLLRSKHSTSNFIAPTWDAIRLGVVSASGATTVSLKNVTGVGLASGVSAFIQFVNDTKVYAATTQAVFNPFASNVALSIFPPLRKATPIDTVVRFYDHVTYHYYLNTDNLQGITYTDGILFGIENVALWEAL
jgi:hypothetical protein